MKFSYNTMTISFGMEIGHSNLDAKDIHLARHTILPFSTHSTQGLPMRIRTLYPKFKVPIHFEDILKTHDDIAHYRVKADIIVLDKGFRERLPGCAKLTVLHEMMHATASDKRLMRFRRLIENLGEYTDGSIASRTEECIAEAGAMVAAKKLGLLNEYSKNVLLAGIDQNYIPGIIIPWREVTAAVRYFAEDDTDFTEELQYVKDYLQLVHKVRVEETYSNRNKTA